MTSNIRFDNPSDGPHRWDYRKNLLLHLFNSYQPDFLATQEGRHQQLLELESLLTQMPLSQTNRTWIKDRMYPCLFIAQRKNIKILNSGDFWLSETPLVPGSSSFHSKYPRLCTWIEVIIQQKSFYIFNAHLDHLSADVRLEQMKVLCAMIKKLNTHEFPFILMGDFNTSPFSLERKYLASFFPTLYDPWIKLGLKEETTHHLFDGKENNGSRIDWILATNEFTCQRLVLEKSHWNKIYPSDHYPLYAEFKL